MDSKVLPFLRWAGGKRWLSNKVAPIIKTRLKGVYFEPFLGAGAMFFTVAPSKAVLSDLNCDLINAFQIVAERPSRLLNAIRKLPVNSDTYYKIRSRKPQNNFTKAVYFIYLNRTCYGGLYRTNRKGDFNVPYGGGSRSPKPLWEKGILNRASEILKSSELHFYVKDFEEVIGKAKSGDIIYCDPTYARTKREQFDRYNGNIFSWEDQKRLATSCHKAFSRGALVIISNTYSRGIKELYSKAYRICLERNKAIGNRPKHEKSGLEYLIVLDPQRKRKMWTSLGKVE